MIGISGIKIVAIGDSITYGFPYTPAESWFNRAAERLKVSHVNSGVNGDTTAGMVARFDRDVLRHRPTHVLIMGGTNDAYLSAGVDRVAANLRRMAERAAASGVIPLFGRPIPCDDPAVESLLGQYRRAIDNYAAANGLVVLDFYAALTGGDGTREAGLYSDEAHPNQAGYGVMTNVAVAGLRGILQEDG